MEKALRKWFPLFVLPTLCAFIIGFIIPFAEGIYLSFCEFTTVSDAKFIGLSLDTTPHQSASYTLQLFEGGELCVENKAKLTTNDVYDETRNNKHYSNCLQY